MGDTPCISLLLRLRVGFTSWIALCDHGSHGGVGGVSNPRQTITYNVELQPTSFTTLDT